MRIILLLIYVFCFRLSSMNVECITSLIMLISRSNTMMGQGKTGKELVWCLQRSHQEGMNCTNNTVREGHSGLWSVCWAGLLSQEVWVWDLPCSLCTVGVWDTELPMSGKHVKMLDKNSQQLIGTSCQRNWDKTLAGITWQECMLYLFFFFTP